MLALATVVVTPIPARATPADRLCTGAWNHSTATVTFQRAPGGTLAWGFSLTTGAIGQLGPTVTVAMPFAYVDGRPINPPYQPHTNIAGYNFHGSLNRFQVLGGAVEGLRDGQNVTFFWTLKGSRPGVVGERYITCKVPPSGAA